MAILIRILILVILGYWAYRVYKTQFATPRQSHSGFGSRSNSSSPYKVLGLSSSASQEEIQRAYKTLIAEYHPDKVSHLGEEIRNLAQEKTQEINQAYNQLKK